ncbi:unnamed protein product [Boreogadus saida]
MDPKEQQELLERIQDTDEEEKYPLLFTFDFQEDMEEVFHNMAAEEDLRVNAMFLGRWVDSQVRNGSDRKGAGRIAFPPPKVGVTRTLPYPTRHHSGDCSVAVPKTLAWANKEVETFVCILGEEDVVYDVYVAAAAIDIRPTTKGTVGSGNATSELSWANRSLPTAPLRSDPFRTLQWKCGIIHFGYTQR